MFRFPNKELRAQQGEEALMDWTRAPSSTNSLGLSLKHPTLTLSLELLLSFCPLKQPVLLWAWFLWGDKENPAEAPAESLSSVLSVFSCILAD